jgi:hypothetical protein
MRLGEYLLARQPANLQPIGAADQRKRWTE